jgi:hypothetical protein
LFLFFLEQASQEANTKKAQMPKILVIFILQMLYILVQS